MEEGVLLEHGAAEEVGKLYRRLWDTAVNSLRRHCISKNLIFVAGLLNRWFLDGNSRGLPECLHKATGSLNQGQGTLIKVQKELSKFKSKKLVSMDQWCNIVAVANMAPLVSKKGPQVAPLVEGLTRSYL